MKISSVFIFQEQLNYEGVYNTQITIGTNNNAANNPICTVIMMSGMYICDCPLTGNYLGLRQEVVVGYYFGGFMEIRAYETLPLEMTSDMLSDTSGSPNPSLIEALSLSLSYPGVESFWNDHKSLSENGIWQVNFGSSKSVKAVLVIAHNSNWHMTLGDSVTPTSNLT